MILSHLLLTSLSAAAPVQDTHLPNVYALRVGRAETIANGAVEHAVVLVENGKITVVGEDLPIERGIPVVDRPDWVLMPGLVNCYSRAGMDSRGASSSEPHLRASAELYPRQDVYDDLLELGVTTLGLYPSGSGIPGQAVAVKPRGETKEEMILSDSVYLKVVLRSNVKSKKMLMSGFKKADEHDEKVKKAREKWEKAQEKKKKKKKSKSKKDDDEDKKDDKDEKEDKEDKEDKKDGKDEDSDVFTPPEPDEKVQPFLDLREGKLSALMSISKASDYLHLVDALGDEEIEYSVHCALRNDIDLYEVKDKLGEAEARIVLEPEITLQPWTRRDRNLPAEFAEAGAKLAFVPRSDSLSSHQNWLTDVGHLVKAGLDRDVALRAMTLEPAEVLGLGERLGSIEKDKDANLVLFDGDPFEPSTRIRMVILEGENVYEYEPVYGGENR